MRMATGAEKTRQQGAAASEVQPPKVTSRVDKPKRQVKKRDGKIGTNKQKAGGVWIGRATSLCTAETRISGGRDGAWDGRWRAGVLKAQWRFCLQGTKPAGGGRRREGGF